MTVNRWHSHPDPTLRNSGDTIDTHQQRVMALCHSLAAAIGHPLTKSDLLRAARHHDEAERVLGDMPAPAKAQFPALAAAYLKAEISVLADADLTWNLTRIENDMLAICDRLDAWLWATAHGATGSEWNEAKANILIIASRIGPKATEWAKQEMKPHG